MASAAAASAAAMEALVVAVCVALLLHSSAGHQPPMSARPPPPPHCHYTGQQAPPPPPSSPVPTSPPPTPVPAPMPTPTLPPVAATPTPAPAPINNCTFTDCASQCSLMCQAGHDAGIAKCKSDLVTNFNGCYDICTSHACPGDSCVDSGCGFSLCPCDNANATSCCQGCGSVVYPQYQSCWNHQDKAVGYCMTDCQNTCYKNCTQG